MSKVCLYKSNLFNNTEYLINMIEQPKYAHTNKNNTPQTRIPQKIPNSAVTVKPMCKVYAHV